jgi:hypothetical protein
MKMNKRIAPTIVLVVITFFIILQTVVMIYALSQGGLGLFWKILIILVPLLIFVALVWVYVERIQEIREEEKDDLSRY